MIITITCSATTTTNIEQKTIKRGREPIIKATIDSKVAPRRESITKPIRNFSKEPTGRKPIIQFVNGIGKSPSADKQIIRKSQNPQKETSINVINEPIIPIQEKRIEDRTIGNGKTFDETKEISSEIADVSIENKEANQGEKFLIKTKEQNNSTITPQPLSRSEPKSSENKMESGKISALAPSNQMKSEERSSLELSNQTGKKTTSLQPTPGYTPNGIDGMSAPTRSEVIEQTQIKMDRQKKVIAENQRKVDTVESSFKEKNKGSTYSNKSSSSRGSKASFVAPTQGDTTKVAEKDKKNEPEEPKSSKIYTSLTNQGIGSHSVYSPKSALDKTTVEKKTTAAEKEIQVFDKIFEKEKEKIEQNSDEVQETNQKFGENKENVVSGTKTTEEGQITETLSLLKDERGNETVMKETIFIPFDLNNIKVEESRIEDKVDEKVDEKSNVKNTESKTELKESSTENKTRKESKLESEKFNVGNQQEPNLHDKEPEVDTQHCSACEQRSALRSELENKEEKTEATTEKVEPKIEKIEPTEITIVKPVVKPIETQTAEKKGKPKETKKAAQERKGKIKGEKKTPAATKTPGGTKGSNSGKVVTAKAESKKKQTPGMRLSVKPDGAVFDNETEASTPKAEQTEVKSSSAVTPTKVVLGAGAAATLGLGFLLYNKDSDEGALEE